MAPDLPLSLQHLQAVAQGAAANAQGQHQLALGR
jgi:hypothetical protein